MPLAPHPYHMVVFFKQSSLFHPSPPIKVNCITFDAVVRLSDRDRDLYWALGQRFVCKKAGHRSETCCCLGQHTVPICRHFGNDPHCESVPSVLDDLWFTLLIGLDDEWVDSHSKCSDVSYTAEQWSSAGWGNSWDMSKFCEEGGLLSPCESFCPSMALEFQSLCSNAFVLGLVNVARKAMESNSIGSKGNPIEVE